MAVGGVVLVLEVGDRDSGFEQVGPTDRSPIVGPPDLYPCCRSIIVRVEGRVIIGRSHAPSVFVVGAPANRFTAAIR
jgi:hypothetical protein